MKKLILAVAAVSMAAAFTNCQKEDKTPTEIQDAKVVSTVAPGETLQEMVGDVVETTEGSDGQTVAEGEGVAVENVEVQPDGATTKPAVDKTAQ